MQGGEGSGSGTLCIGRKARKWVVLLKTQELSCLWSFPCQSPVLHRLCPEPFHGAWHHAGAALLRPSISLTHLCTPAPGLSVLPPCTDSPSWAAVGPLPPSDLLLRDVPSKTATYDITLPVGFFCKHLIYAGADPNRDQGRYLALLCPPVQGRGPKLLSKHLVKWMVTASLSSFLFFSSSFLHIFFELFLSSLVTS